MIPEEVKIRLLDLASQGETAKSAHRMACDEFGDDVISMREVESGFAYLHQHDPGKFPAGHA